MSDGSNTEPVASFMDRIKDPKARLAYCAERAGNMREYSLGAGKVCQAAGRLLGWSQEKARNRLNLIHRKGLGGAIAWLADLNRKDPLAEIQALDSGLIGWVYRACWVDEPSIFKVGFSRQPQARLQQLEREYGVRLELASAEVGTMLDEFAWHRANRRDGICGEWFYAPDSPLKTVPEFLLRKYSPALLPRAS